MAFPQDILPIRTELNIDGSWVDITGDVRAEQGIQIKRGRTAATGDVDYGRCSLVLSNAGGKYSPRNPRSPYYGLIGRNTPIRVSVHTGDPYLYLDGGPTGYVSTPDTAALDITGDIDIRVEASINWQDTDTNQVLISKWQAAGNQRSYALRVYNDQLWLDWSTDGTLTGGRQAWMTLPALPRHRAAVRVTLDVDNGDGQITARFYWAESLAGPWEQIGDDIIGSFGVAPIFASTTPLHIGHHDPLPAVPQVPPPGRVYAVQILDGIDGTPVVDVDFTAQTPGATSFTDDAGITWTVQGTAEITNRQERFVGEVSEWPPQWDTGGHDVTAPIEASGLLRRYRQGNSPLDSTLRRRIPSDPNLVAYWPMEEGENATRCYSPIEGVQPLTVSGLDFAADDTLPGSGPLPKLGSTAELRGSVPRASTSGWQVECVYHLPNMPAVQTEILRVTVTGSTMATAIVYASVAGVRIEALDSDGTVLAFFLFSDADALADFHGEWNRLRIFTSDNGGGQTLLTVNWLNITAGGGYWVASTIYTGDMGAVTAVSGTWGAETAGMSIGHLGVFAVPGTGATSPGSSIYDGADDAFDGETALIRMYRLAKEEGFPLARYDGDLTVGSAQVGPQRRATTLDLLQAAADVDGGILYERREALGLIYRDRASLYNQDPLLVVDYGGGDGLMAPLNPVDDDQHVLNDVTVTREGGSSGRAVLEEGPLSVQDPPAGVGRYDTSITLSLYDDDQPVQHAGWLLHLGTWDEARYPLVRLNLAAAPHKILDAVLVDVGDRIQITNPPAWLPPDTIDLMVQGYTETLAQYEWTIEYNCTPAGPWNVAHVEDDTYGWADTDGSELAAVATDTDTRLPVTVTAGPQWTTDPTDFPFDVRVGGEVMTVTSITDGPITDSFDRTESSGWGSTDTGQAWTTTGGSASDYSVSGGVGFHSVGSLNVNRLSLVTMSDADFDLQVSFSTPVLATGNNQQIYLIARYLDGNNYYGARVDFTPAQAVTITLIKVVSGTPQAFTTVTTDLVHEADKLFRLRFQGAGSTLQAKVWEVGGDEPDSWQTTVTDTDLSAAGSVGVRTRFLTGNTNTLPVLVSFDDFSAPQVFTVTRSVNGISKAHSAGTDVRLAYPAIVAL